MQIYVTTRKNGFINGWYKKNPPENTKLIDANKSFVGNLDCIKIKEGEAVFDEGEYNKIQKENSTDEISNLKQAITALGGSV